MECVRCDSAAILESLRQRRRGKVGRSWYVDETYIKVHGQWRYLYRAIDRSGADAGGKTTLFGMKPVADDPGASRKLRRFAHAEADPRREKLGVAGDEASGSLRHRPNDQACAEQNAWAHSVDENPCRQLREGVAHEKCREQYAHRGRAQAKLLPNFDIGNGKPCLPSPTAWLACALGHKACRDGFSVLYRRAPRLFADLATARGEGRLARLMRSLERTRLLIIDDWGPEPLNAEQRRDLLEIVDDREGKGSLLITSQVPIGRWHEIIGDPTLGDAILDRVIHRSHRIELKGESLRKRQALAAVESLTKAKEK
jgi:hypothetical protein